METTYPFRLLSYVLATLPYSTKICSLLCLFSAPARPLTGFCTPLRPYSMLHPTSHASFTSHPLLPPLPITHTALSTPKTPSQHPLPYSPCPLPAPQTRAPVNIKQQTESAAAWLFHFRYKYEFREKEQSRVAKRKGGSGEGSREVE